MCARGESLDNSPTERSCWTRSTATSGVKGCLRTTMERRDEPAGVGRRSGGTDPVQRAWTIAGFAVVIFVGLFWQLGAHSFWDPDEAHYAETTRELLDSGDWLAPYYNEQPFFDKPILFHLLQAVPMATVGR